MQASVALLKAFGLKFKKYKFAHAARFALPNQTIMVDSYHYSRYNTQTKRLTEAMFHAVLLDIQLLLKKGELKCHSLM